MDEITQALSSPVFWVLTVLVGLLINIIAPYINKMIDKILYPYARKSVSSTLGRISVYFHRKGEERRLKIERESKELLSRQTGILEAQGLRIYYAIMSAAAITVTNLAAIFIYLLEIDPAMAEDAKPVWRFAFNLLLIVGILLINRFFSRMQFFRNVYEKVKSQLHNDWLRQLEITKADS